jgi:hypothetical protein
MVARLGSARASAVRADHRRMASGDVRDTARFRLSHADSVGRCRAGSGYRMGLQVGGRGFESRTLHLRKMPFAGFLLALFPSLATAVRARCERTSNGCRPHSSEVESRALVDRSRVTSSTGAGLTCRRLRVRVPSLRSRKTCKSTYSVAGLDTAPAHAPHAARARAARNARKPAQWRPRVTSSSRLRRAARPIARGDRRAHRMAGGQERRR